MSKTSSYIFAHDQEIILDADRSGKFNMLPDLKYVFLGMGATDKVIGRQDVIISRDLTHNIEQYPKFCSLTGWYALWKNNLLTSEFIHLMEYDIEIHPKFKDTTESLMEQKHDFIGYVPLSILFGFIEPYKYLSNLLPVIDRHYNMQVGEFVRKMHRENRKSQWSSTSNSTFSLEAFNEYMTWFEKLIDDIKDDKMCGHMHERSLSIFCWLFKKKFVLTEKLLKHHMKNSHQTSF